MPSALQYWSAEAGSGGIFENLTLSVVDMRGNLWAISGLFGMVCDGFRRAYACDLRTPTVLPSRHSELNLPQQSDQPSKRPPQRPIL